MSKIFIKVTFFIFSTLLAQPGKSILLLNQFDEQLPELNSSLDNNFSGSRFQIMEPIENLITDLDTSKYPAANRMGLVKQIGSEYKVDYIIFNQIQNQGNRFFLEGQIFSTRSGGLILRRKLDLLNYEDGRMNELNLWIGEIMEVLYPGWVQKEIKFY